MVTSCRGSVILDEVIVQGRVGAALRVGAKPDHYFTPAVACVCNGQGTNSRISLPLSGSFKRTAPSKPADATSLPSGRKATAYTGPRSPSSLEINLPSAA